MVGDNDRWLTYVFIVATVICVGFFYWDENYSDVDDGYCASSKVERYSKIKNMKEKCDKAMVACERKKGCIVQAIVRKS